MILESHEGLEADYNEKQGHVSANGESAYSRRRTGVIVVSVPVLGVNPGFPGVVVVTWVRVLVHGHHQLGYQSVPVLGQYHAQLLHDLGVVFGDVARFARVQGEIEQAVAGVAGYVAVTADVGRVADVGATQNRRLGLELPHYALLGNRYSQVFAYRVRYGALQYPRGVVGTSLQSSARFTLHVVVEATVRRA